MSIDTLATFLLLPYIRNNYALLAKEARAKDYSYEQFLEQLLQGETDQRRNNSLYKRIRKARFPYQMELGDFKTEHLSTELKRKIKQLENLEFISLIHLCSLTDDGDLGSDVQFADHPVQETF